MLNELQYWLEVWTLNQIYDKVKNCKVVKPPYEWDNGIYNKKFFLDKRDWHTWFKENAWYTYTDMLIVNWVKHYLYNNWTNAYVWMESWSDIVQIAWPFAINSNSPIRMVKWYGGWWTLIASWTITNPSSTNPSWTDLQYYWDWWVKLTLSSVTNVATWQYIQFQDWILKWWCNYIYEKSWSDIYIIWTNTRWNLPLTWASYKIFSEKKENILIWCSTWVYLINIDWTSTPSTIQLSTVEIYDIVQFNGVIFYLTKNEIWFSRKSFDDNTNFHPLDRFIWTNVEKLIDLWKILLAIGWTNKAYAPATNTDNTIWYVEYDVNYQWSLYSKYSYIYADSTFYILQSDKQLKQINVVTVNATTYDLQTENIEDNNRWLFESISWWNVFVNHDDRYINFCSVNWWTTIYQYDKQYKHWLLHTYTKQIYLYSSRVLCNWWVWQQSWLLDWWEFFSQEVNYMANEDWRIMFPFLLRTFFWLTWERMDVNLEITHIEWANLSTVNKYFWNYLFDATLKNNEVEDLIWYEEETWYNGNTISLQHNIFRAWRFFKFRIYSEKRFILWESHLYYKKSKFYINEILQSN